MVSGKGWESSNERGNDGENREVNQSTALTLEAE